MKRFIILFVMGLIAMNLMASSEITYMAKKKLPYNKKNGIYKKAFNVAIKDHQFSNGRGTIIFEGELTSVGDHAFEGCSGMTQIKLPNSVKSIGDHAFAWCRELTTVVNSISVTNIGSHAFFGCHHLNSITFPDSVTDIGTFAFYDCSSLTDITLPNSLKTIGKFAFSCSGIKSLEIPNSINNIALGTFHNCKKLYNVTIPNSVTEIEGAAFYMCSNLTSIVIPSSVRLIGSGAFTGCDNLVIYVSPESEHQYRAMAALSGKYIVADPRLSDRSTAPLASLPQISQPFQLDSHSTPSHASLPTLQKKSVVDTNIPTSGTVNDKTFVIILANEYYQEEVSVPYAHHDGDVFRQYCVNTLGIPEKNIHYRHDATLNNIRKEIGWLSNICEALEGEASVIFYYAGHGIPDEQSKAAYLLPADGVGSEVMTGYKLDDLYAALGKMSARHVTVIMDACFSGSKREEGMLTLARGVALKVKAGAPQGNMVVFSAASGDETAYPNHEEGHGMFTYYLLKKLQDTKGDVTLQELGDYVTKNVRQQSILLNGKSQTPTVTPATAVAGEWGSWKLK